MTVDAGLDFTLKVTRVAHATVLVDFGGWAILTDPWFSEKFGYHRGEPLGVVPGALPGLAGVVVSHDHADHNDMATCARYVDKRVPILLERRAARRAIAAGFENVTGLDTWQTVTLGPITVTAVPAKHGVPEVGYVLQGLGFTVYFGGDTLLIPALSEIAQRFPAIDVALLPINGLCVFGKQVVMNPLEAAELCKILQPRYAIPTHYAFTGGPIMDALFLKYFEPQGRLPQTFVDAVSEHAPETNAVVLAPGEVLAVRTSDSALVRQVPLSGGA